ncbi:dynein light chain LC8-type, partial [Paragonimus westermani]
MPREMQERAIQVAADALERYTQDWEIGAHVREQFDNQYKPVWHCIVGRSFG